MSDEPARFVLGICYQAGPDPRIKRGVDGGRDWFSKAELERACWSYMRSGCPQINAFHVDGTEDCAEPVESFIWRWDDWDVGDGIVVKDGDWCLGAILSPRMWELYKAGEINGYSPEGTAIRRRVQKEGAVALAKGSADEVDDDDEFSELVNANVPKVALVGQGANGIPRFLMSKQAGGALFDPAYVRDLIEKSEPTTEASYAGETVTMSGSPAAIAALIHGAPVRKATPEAAEPDDVLKAKYDTADRKKMAGHQAMADGSYPIADKEDLSHAIHAVGRGDNNSHAAIRRHIISRAKSLGASSEIPDNWGADGSLKKSDSEPTEQTEVTKDMDEMPMDDAGGMDPCVVLAEPEDEAPGDPGDPGSPAWEGIDAATARKWTAIAARLRSALGVMADREGLEAATVDPDDAEHAMDLDDAACAVDYVISTLAAFAVDEQAEADDAVMAMVGKAMADVDTAHLDTVESLGSVRKAGRALSGANESALRAAITALQQILASLPKAPAATMSGQTVAKTANEEPNMPEPTPAEDVTAASGQQPAMGAASLEPKPVAGEVVTDVAKAAAPTEAPAPVAKAEKTPQVAIYDAKGNLVGTVDPAEITMLAPAKAPEAAAASDPAPEEPAAATAEAPAATPTDLAPAPAASVGTPADAVPADDDSVAKAAETTENNEAQEVLKGSIQELVKAAIAEHSAPTGELIKSLENQNRALEERNETLAKQAAELSERLTKVENAPAVMAIASNGVTPPSHLMRGQDHGARVDVTKGEQLRAAFKASDDARQQKVLAEDMNLMAIDKLHEIHAAGPR